MTDKSPTTNPPNVLSFEKAYLFPSYFLAYPAKRAPAEADAALHQFCRRGALS